MIHELRKKGQAIAEIARLTRRGRRTVRKYLQRGMEQPKYGPQSAVVPGQPCDSPDARRRSDGGMRLLAGIMWGACGIKPLQGHLEAPQEEGFP
jgi:predicted transcriptional regulator